MGGNSATCYFLKLSVDISNSMSKLRPVIEHVRAWEGDWVQRIPGPRLDPTWK